VIVFLYDTLSQHFGVSKKAIIFTTTATLALRPWAHLFLGCSPTGMAAAFR